MVAVAGCAPDQELRDQVIKGSLISSGPGKPFGKSGFHARECSHVDDVFNVFNLFSDLE